MREQKTTAESEVDITSIVESMFSGLDDADTGEHQINVVPLASNTSFSLERLEQDLKMLQARWRSVEQEVEHRDEQINALKAEKGELLAQLSDQQQIQQRNQDLQDYIDKKTGDWDRQNASIREFEDTIIGMVSSLESNEKLIGEKEKEKAALALEVMESERKLAELAGRYTEREAAQAELQQSGENQSRELGGLNREVIRLHKDIEKLQEKLARKAATVQELKQEIEDRNLDGTSMKSLLETEKSVNGELRERLRASEPTTDKYESRIRDLETSLHDSETKQHDLQIELVTTRTKLDEVEKRSAEHSIRATELDAVLMEMQSEKENLEQELAAQVELVDVLEREVSKNRVNQQLLDGSAERMSAIGSGIRKLDMLIDERWHQRPTRLIEDSEELSEPANDVMLAPEELLEHPASEAEHVIVLVENGGMRFPLDRKVMTMGRSPENDIRIRNRYISRVHARITVDGPTATIEDAGSTNGFFINSVHMTHHVLVDGDEVEIGTSKFRYLHTAHA